MLCYSRRKTEMARTDKLVEEAKRVLQQSARCDCSEVLSKLLEEVEVLLAVYEAAEDFVSKSEDEKYSYTDEQCAYDELVEVLENSYE